MILMFCPLINGSNGKAKMKPEYHEGPEARKKFDEGMTKLFRSPKAAKNAPKPKPKRKKSSKD
jgi:hypothetical protein